MTWAEDPLLLMAFSLGSTSPSGFWAHPEDTSTGYLDVHYWTSLATRLEAGGFDGVFFADALGHTDVYGGSPDAALRNAVQSPLIDPVLIIPAMAAVTERLAFGVTVSTTYELPYTLARKFTTLDHLTGGRIAWNVVTSLQDSAARNLGLGAQIPHDERYDRAQEFMEVCYKLWEGSWEDGAVVADRATRTYIDPSKVHPIDHEGRWFRVPGAALAEPGPQRTPVIYQAGASPRGMEFAGANAEVVFLGGHSDDAIRRSVQSIRAAAQRAGRDPRAVKFLCGASIVAGATHDEAHARYAELVAESSREAALVLLASWTGVDWSRYDPHEPLRDIKTDASQSTLANLTNVDPDRVWTLQEVADYMGIGGLHPKFIGDGEEIADQLARFVRATGIDGVVMADAVMPGTFDEFIRYAVPVLRERGMLLPQERRFGSLRERLQGEGRRLLADDHPGTRFRHPSVGARGVRPDGRG